MRKVCVVSNVIGNRDVIHNGENGFVCSNTEEFVKAIKEAQNGADGFTERAYSDTITLPEGGNYIGIECENFTGSIELNME